MVSNWLIEQSVHLDRGAATPMVWPNVLMLAGDSEAHTWEARVYENGAALDMTGGVVTGYFVRADENTVVVQGSITGNLVSVTLAQACYAVEGDVKAVLRLSAGTKVITLSVLILRVRKDMTDAFVDPGEVIPSLDALLVQIAAMEAATTAANAAAGLADAKAALAETKAGLANDAAIAANGAAAVATMAAQAAEDAEIVSAVFVGDDLVFSKTSEETLTLPGAKSALKGDTGNSISSIVQTSGDHSPGTTDTYTITYSDATTTTFTVYNGMNGTTFDMPNVHQYTVRWDKVNSQCTRMGDATAITTAITNFKHSGSVNAAYDNPFDSLYPWKYRKLCKVNRAAYAALTPGSPITDAVTMWEGEPGFALDGSGDFDGVYTPEFWGRIWEDATYVYAGVADGPIPGWQHFEATIGGRYFASLDGNTKMTSIAGSIAWRGATLAAMRANAQAQELTLDDIFTWCADTLLMAVEYATLNSQTALGSGCSALYRLMQKVGEAASAGATVLKLNNATAAFCVAGAVLDFGTTDGGVELGWTRFVSSADLEAEDPLFATHKAVTVTPIPQNVTVNTYCGVHGCYNAPDTGIMSMSGYIGTAGKCNAYYRGRVAHANYWRYVLGAYRQTGTGRIWVANSRAEAAAADTLNTGVHRDTGFVLPTSAGDYIATLHLDTLLPLAPFVKTVGGGAGSDNPVGDSSFTPTLATAGTNLLGGAGVYDGAVCGRFAAGWTQAAGNSSWGLGALPFLKTP